ncbi:protein unc-79 homolog isoform X4 [Penaeus japonicus]|uniref:protein unc-79 homolog isoform X4 n=1 Tax=Penaeus japonicus TaxID=27405 RepID=UPI001C70EE0D|nr:protein unc-79 homolog isoform X4 [Penaeus japonicus]
MGTRAAAFTAKIRNLNDFHTRLLHGVVPAPSGLDIANTLKYFSQTLLGVLREIQERPVDMLRCRDQDAIRLALFPNLDYAGLHQSIVALVDIMPLIQYGTQAFGQAMLNTLACLVLFLERKVIDTMPYLVASMMTSIPESLHQQLITILCYHILPVTVGAPAIEGEEENYAAASVPAVLMMIFQYTDNSAYHCQLLECLMSLKSDIAKDLLCVIAYGTPTSRSPAANLLFYYWPSLNPTLYDRRGIHIKFSDISSVLKAMFNKSAQAAKSDSISQTANSDSGESKNPKGWKPLLCQIEECDGDGTSEAVKVCFDHAVCLGACPENPPPLFLCLDCAEEIRREHNTVEFFDILMPMAQVSATCENKNCRSTEKNAIATCYSMECASYNSNRPIRYCSQCNNIRHNNRRGTDHVVHTTIGSPWAMDPQMQNFTIEAIVSLLNEAQPFGDKTKSKDQERLNRAGLLDDVDQVECLTPEESRLLSRYGVWLIVGLCAPTPDTPIEMLGRILAALCHWFNATQYLPDDQQGTAIERLKSEYIHNWLQDVCKTHFEVFVSCLMPHPVEYARVGGHWDTLATRTDHIKEGFNRLFCLVPYELITVQVWDRVMPNWMEAIHNEIPEDELTELKITLSKLLDTDMSPLGFDASQMYGFLSVRFVSTQASVQEQTLSWLQILSSLNIVIPMSLLLTMFSDGVSSLCNPPAPARKTSTSNRTDSAILEPVVEDDSHSSSGLSEDEKPPSEHPEDHYSDPELNLTCFVLMLDVLFKQMEVQEIEKHQGVDGADSKVVTKLLKDMLNAPCMCPHTCDGERECTTCELTTAFFQLQMDVVAYLCPRVAIQNNRVADIIPQEIDSSQANKSPELSSQDPPTVTSSQSPKPGVHPPSKEGGLISMMVNMPQIVTATVETVGELDIAANIPQEHVVKAVARAVTLTEEDVVSSGAHATANVARPSVVDEDDKPIDTTQHSDEESDSFWVTSQGKFKFKMEELPSHLQVIYTILKRLETTEDGDVVYHMCECLKYLVLHGEAMAHAANEHRGFLIWCQENKSIKIMWSLIEAEWSHVAEVCVSLLLHFVTLPCGSDIFWKLCENHFNHQDWKVRFQAVEKVVVIGRFLGLSAVRQCPGLQAAIAHAFCFLIASLDDINVAVAQRASLYLTTLPDCGLRALCWCLEQQFDSVIMDRPMIIQALHQLSSRLPDRRILSWEFFYNRFDALYLEAQIALEKYGDIAFPRDLKNSDMTSDVFERKLSKAKDALTLVQSASVRTLSGSLGTKWPYKRTMSAPANMLNRAVEKQVDKGKEKTYLRQASAPLLKCKSSKFGLGQFIGSNQSNHLVSADGGMRCGDDGSVVHQLQRAMDLEETDKDTLHLLVFLFMQFLSQPQHVGGNEDKGSVKVMNLVLRHLSVLMGFSPQERCFSISPARLRSSPVFNAFLSNLPHVLDHNFCMGISLLPSCLPVLQFCAAPHRVVDLRYPTFSLWGLQPHARRCWLKSVLTLLYKYEYSQHPLSGQALSLVRIVLNTIENHYHRCRKVDDPTMCAASSAYSREVSQGSIGGNEGEHPVESPPLSPGAYPGGRITFSTGGHHADPRAQYFAETKSAFVPVGQESKSIQALHGHHKSAEESRKQRKNNESNQGVDCDEAEPELEAIPESPKTDSPVCQESLGELGSYENEIKGEKAVMCVEDNHSTRGYIIHSPCAMLTPATATASVVVPPTIPIRAQVVTSVMASQIQAFDESFTVKIHNAELATMSSAVRDDGKIISSSTQGNNSHNSSNCQHKWILGGDDCQEIDTPEKTKVAQAKPLAKPKVQRVKTVDLGFLGHTTSLDNQLQKINGRDMKTLSVVSSQVSPKSHRPVSQKAAGNVFRPIENQSRSTADFQEGSMRERLLPVGLERCGTSDCGCAKDASLELRANRAVFSEVPKLEQVEATVTETSVYDPSVIQAVNQGDIRRVSDDKEGSVHSGHIHHQSPQSPLSMMDLMTLGSPVELDGMTSTTDSPNTELVSPPDVLELPSREVLLPVGGEKQTTPIKKHDDHQPGSILERVWQAFGGWANGSKSNNQSSSECELVEVVAHKEAQKQGKTKQNMKSQRVLMDKQDQQNTSTEETTDTSNSGTTTNNSGPGDTCPVKSGMRSKSKPTTETEDEVLNDTYRWSDRNEMPSVRGGVTNGNPPGAPPPSSIKQSYLRVGEDCMVYRCMECGEILEEFSNDDLGLCIIILSTFVYRQPGLAAPLLPRMLKTVARVAGSEVFSWQYENCIHLPGSATSIGRQFLRCVLHQLAPNQIFNQIFYTNVEEYQRLQLFKTLAQALMDFNELNPSAPIQLLLETQNAKKVLPTENLTHLLGNVASYMEGVIHDGGGGLSSSLVPLFDTFLRKVLLCVSELPDLNPVLRVIVATLKIPGVSAHKSILDPVSKLVSHSIQNSTIKYEHLSDLCYICNRIFSRERDKLLLPRLVVYELVQALKFKTSIPDTNLVLLVQLVVQDSGGTLGSNSVVGDLPKNVQDIHNLPNTCAAECMRSHLHDALEFIADVHTLTKVKSNCRSSVGLNEDTMGGLVKAGISQYLALEITRGNSRDNRAIAKYLPWLNNPPTAVQQGPKEFIDCVSHIRLLSWLLLGALTHTCLVGNFATMVCQPIPPEASCHIADHIQVILAGFAEQSKASVLHMSSLFHAFILCQLWTVYLEQGAGSPGSDSYSSICAILTDFWAKVTPGILQLVSHSKVLGEMVNLHFLSLMEALHECQSTVLTKLLPLWAPVLYTHHIKLPGQLAVRLQVCQNAAPPLDQDVPGCTTSVPSLLRWLHRLQFKMGQIELQSSAATQFYSV